MLVRGSGASAAVGGGGRGLVPRVGADGIELSCEIEKEIGGLVVVVGSGCDFFWRFGRGLIAATGNWARAVSAGGRGGSD